MPSCLLNRNNLKIDFCRSEDNNIDDPATNETIRIKCWVEVASRKNKGRLYGVGQLATNPGGSGSLNAPTIFFHFQC